MCEDTTDEVTGLAPVQFEVRFESRPPTLKYRSEVSRPEFLIQISNTLKCRRAGCEQCSQFTSLTLVGRLRPPTVTPVVPACEVSYEFCRAHLGHVNLAGVGIRARPGRDLAKRGTWFVNRSEPDVQFKKLSLEQRR